jgi:hypothetical protein
MIKRVPEMEAPCSTAVLTLRINSYLKPYFGSDSVTVEKD